MIKGKRTSTFMVLSVLILLIVLLMSFINISYAWFSYSNIDGDGNYRKSVISYIDMSEVDLAVYQKFSDGEEVRLNELDAETTNAIKLYFDSAKATNNLIKPGEVNNLTLVLKNAELGATFGVKFKVTFYATTLNGRVELDSEILGMSEPDGTQNGFVLDSADGYYYYQDNGKNKQVFESGKLDADNKTVITNDRVMMTGFKIKANEKYYNLVGGNSIIMVVDIQNVTISKN